MNKKTIGMMTLLLAGILATGCSSTAASKQTQKPAEQDQSEQGKSTYTFNEGDKDEHKTDSSTLNQNEIAIDQYGNLSMNDLIAQLEKDGIVSGEIKELSSAVEGAAKTIQIGHAIIIEFKSDTVAPYIEAIKNGTITIANESHKVTSINQNFVLVLLEGDQAKADASFSRSNAQGGMLTF